MERNTLISAGRSQKTWKRTVVGESKIIGKSWKELKALAHNRTRWKIGFINTPCDRGKEVGEENLTLSTIFEYTHIGFKSLVAPK